jgi:hypothetical protein
MPGLLDRLREVRGQRGGRSLPGAVPGAATLGASLAHSGSARGGRPGCVPGSFRQWANPAVLALRCLQAGLGAAIAGVLRQGVEGEEFCKWCDLLVKVLQAPSHSPSNDELGRMTSQAVRWVDVHGAWALVCSVQLTLEQWAASPCDPERRSPPAAGCICAQWDAGDAGGKAGGHNAARPQQTWLPSGGAGPHWCAPPAV